MPRFGELRFVHLGCLRYWIRGRLNLTDGATGGVTAEHVVQSEGTASLRHSRSRNEINKPRRSKKSFPPDVWEIFPKPGPYMMKVQRLLSANNAIFCISSDVVDSFLVEGSYFYRPLACELCKVDLGEFHTANQPSERSSQDCWWTVYSWHFFGYSKSWKCKHHGRCDSKTQTDGSHYWVQIHSK